MSQMVTRKGPVGDDKDKGQTDSPVKEMKKKMAANAEKEKQAAEKSAEKDKDKNADKHPEKATKENDKSADKASDKKDKAEKISDKKEKPGDKEKDKGEKSADKKNEIPAEKPKEDKSAKPDKPPSEDREKDKKRAPDTPKPKQNGGANNRANGVPADAHNGGGGEHSDSDATVSSDDDMVIDHERDDMFPELAYDDSDGEFEPPTPEGLPSRSYTRRSQAKATRTPETPRPASDKRPEASDESKESKVLKLKDDTPVTDRKLRSSDSPKPETKKQEKPDKKGEEKEKKGEEKDKKGEKEKEIAKEADTSKKEDKAHKKKDLEASGKEDEGVDKSTVEIVIDLDADEEPAEGKAGERETDREERERSKADTNYSRSRVKVSPYRRAKPADQTTSSVMANYTGNNTTMEMDITESSSFLTDEPTTESPYLSGLRSIRGRRSYKPLKEMAIRNITVNRSLRSTTSVSVSEQPSRPTAPVVGRKRKPEGEDSIEVAMEAHGLETEVRGKRARLLDKLARPFRSMASTPLPARRNAEIVGINTDLPLTAPVASPDTFDPETLKLPPAPLNTPLPLTPPTPSPEHERDGKRCILM